MIRAVARGVNTVVDALNSISFDIPDWVPGFGGETFGISLPRMPEYQIPKLAQGAVLPREQAFPGHGRRPAQRWLNVEAPLETIKQAVAEVLAQMGGGDREVVIKFAASGGLAELVRLLKPYIDKESSRVGASMITGGVY